MAEQQEVAATAALEPIEFTPPFSVDSGGADLLGVHIVDQRGQVYAACTAGMYARNVEANGRACRVAAALNACRRVETADLEAVAEAGGYLALRPAKQAEDYYPADPPLPSDLWCDRMETLFGAVEYRLYDREDYDIINDEPVAITTSQALADLLVKAVQDAAKATAEECPHCEAGYVRDYHSEPYGGEYLSGCVECGGTGLAPAAAPTREEGARDA